MRGWSDWEPLKDGAVASPAGRFLQWKAVLQPGRRLGSVGVNYLPVNAAPVVDEVGGGAGRAAQPAESGSHAADGQHHISLVEPECGRHVRCEREQRRCRR